MPRNNALALAYGHVDTLTADELLTMELYVKAEGGLTPEQTTRLLAWAAAFRPVIEGN